MSKYLASTTLPVSREEAFAYHERPGALSRLIPPWQHVQVESSDQSLEPGSRVVLKTRLGPIPLRWVAEHTQYDPPNSFTDIQLSGPFAAWMHHHRIRAGGEQCCVLEDDIEYKVPFGSLGRFFGSSLVRKELETMFSYRHDVTRNDLALAEKYDTKTMRIAISGSTGLVGQRLSSMLKLLGHKVFSLERSLEKAAGRDDAIAPWDSVSEAEKLSGFDAVVHLAGKPIAEGRWTESSKQQMIDSRVTLTTQLAERLSQLEKKPAVFVCASAIGIYGDRGDEELTEQSEIGEGFLPETCRLWEQACEPARQAGIRVVNARIGLALDPRGGALEKMLLPAKLCGGKLGNGEQWWSWIAIDDLIGAIYHSICTPSLDGPVNLVSPQPMRNKDFARTLGKVLGRPALFPAPAFGLRIALGEMADALLLSSTRVLPTKLQQSGFEFRFEDAASALRYCLGKNRRESQA